MVTFCSTDTSEGSGKDEEVYERYGPTSVDIRRRVSVASSLNNKLAIAYCGKTTSQKRPQSALWRGWG